MSLCPTRQLPMDGVSNEILAIREICDRPTLPRKDEGKMVRVRYDLPIPSQIFRSYACQYHRICRLGGLENV